MRKYCLFLGLLALLLTAPNRSFGQVDAEIEQVFFDQGKIIGNLPYGRHFYIKGSTVLPNGARANKVTVRLWDTGRMKAMRNRDLNALTATQTSSILARTATDSSTWYAERATDTLFFYLYIDRSLQFASEYILEFSFYERMRFNLTESQKDEILKNVERRVYEIFTRSGGVKKSQIRAMINEEVTKTATAEDSATDLFGDQLISNQRYEVKLQPGTIDELSRQIGRYSSSFQIIETLDLEIKAIENELNTLSEDSPDFANAQEELKALKMQQSQARKKIDQLKDELPGMLQVIREQFVETYTSYVITQPGDYAVTELDAVRIGTTFGGGVTGLNMLEDSRDYDAFGYTALKFYFLPVDKRVSQAYIPNRFMINRMSALVGFSISGAMNYKGNQLEKAIGFFPVGGISYDVNRYFSIDLGGTLFRQNSLSPLTQATKLRVAPIIGLTFDADMFNRFKTLLTGDQYQITPGGN